MTRSIHNLGHKFISTLKRPNPNLATKKDLYYCYRLLLNREPDQKGFKDWLKTIKQTQMERQFLVDLFLQSEEFRQRRSQLEAERTEINLPDFKIVVNPYDFSVGKDIIQNKKYEPDVSAVIKSHLKPGDTFVDIGANIGYFTLLAASIVSETGHVYSFEPNANNCKLISQNITLNNFSNVEIFPYAVAESKQILNYHGGNVSSNGHISDKVDDQEAFVQVEAVALDDILLKADTITAIKMDIEGAEARALQGMHQIIKKFKPIIFTEFSPILLTQTSRIAPVDYLANLQEHYDLYVLGLEPKDPGNMKRLSIDKIMEEYNHTAKNHLDLVALPRAA